jgi:hypothetical protein
MQFSYWKNQNFYILSITAIAAVAVGIATLLLPPQMIIIAAVAIIGAGIVLNYPEFGFLAILVFLSSVLSEENIPTVQAGPIQVYITDVILLFLLVIMLVRLLADPDFKLEFSPMSMPLFVFWGFALLSTILGILSDNVIIGRGLHEMRIVSYYLLFFLFIHLIREKKQLERTLDWLFLLATITAAATLAQYILGDTFVFLEGRVEPFSPENQAMANVIRVTDNPGEGLITTAFIVLTIRLFLSQLKFKNIYQFIQWALLGGAMLIGFNRTHWAVAAISLVITFFMTNLDQRKKILTWSLYLLWLLPIIILPGLILPDSPYGQLIQAAFVRLTSLFTTQAYVDPTESTIVWRNFEYLYGIPQLLNHPFFGLGMGALYRPFISKIDGYGNMGPHYTHNGHLWIAMKGGLFAWLALMAFLIIFIVQGLKKWRQVTDPSMQSLALGFSLVGLSVIIASILHPIIITLFWTPLLGIIFGINHVIFKLYTGETETVQTEALPAEYQT